MTVFGPAWDDLELEHLEVFLRDAPAEALRWEAKREMKGGSLRKAVCGFANGYDVGALILGAEERDGAWALDGVEFPNDDPPSAVTDLLTGVAGLTPYPDGLDVKSFQASDGKYVAVVRIPPVAAPPCITGGSVYERVSGKTIPVTDPLRLAQLVERGSVAHLRSAQIAGQAASDALVWARGKYDPAFAQMGVGMAATGYSSNLAVRPFTEDFGARVRSITASVLTGEDPLIGDGGPAIYPDFSQQAVVYPTEAVHRLGDSWMVRISRDGGIGIHWAMAIDEVSVVSLVDRSLRKALVAATEILGSLDPMGPHYLHVIPTGGGLFPPNHGESISSPPHVTRGPLDGTSGSTTLDSIKRELLRATGRIEFEDESDGADS